MAVTPRIFISATSGDLRSHRAVVVEALRKLESYAEAQDHWPPDHGTVASMLRRRIRECDAVIHLAGLRYGAEPRDLPPGFPRRSYTQMEYEIAREMGKPVYVFLLPADFDYDSGVPAEDEEKRALQVAHRQRILDDPHLRYSPPDTAALRGEILSLQPLVEKLRAEIRRSRHRHRLVAAILFLAVAGVAWAVLRERDVNRQQAEAIGDLRKPESAEVKFFREIQLLRSQSPGALGVRPDGGFSRSQGMSYAAALAGVAKDHGLAPEALRGMLDTFATRVLADEDSGSYERAVAEFHRKSFGSAATLATAVAETAEEAAGVQRGKAIEAWVLAGDSEREGVRYPEALAAYRKAMKLADKEEDPIGWSNLAIRVGQMHHELGGWDEARPLFEESLALRERHFGADAPETAEALNHLAPLLQETNRLEEAERMMRRALAIEEAASGRHHPIVAIHLNNLALLLGATHRLEEAERLLRRALAIGGAASGDEDPLVATILTNLGVLLQDANRLEEAEPLLRQALAIDEAISGAEHPDVARDLGNLARLLLETNRLAEAEPLMRRALSIEEAGFGAEHPNVAAALNNLAQLLLETGRPEEAEPLMRRALAIDEAFHGAEHPNVGLDLNNLAGLLLESERLAEAEPLMRRALAIDEASRGREHPDVATDLNNLAWLLSETNRHGEAEPLMRRALAIDEASYGGEHPSVASDLGNLAWLLIDTGRFEEAETLIRRALAIDETSYGGDHPTVAIRLHCLAQLLRKTNRLAEAVPLSARHLEIFVKSTVSTGHPHPNLRAAVNHHAEILREAGDSPEEINARLAGFLAGTGIAYPFK